MSFDFSKLSRVPINDDITDNTYTIVANLDDIQKASLKAAVHTRDNYTGECEAYIVSNPTKTPIDYIRTLSPLQPSTQNPNEYIRSGYIIFHDVYYLFDVYGDANHSYYDIITTDFNTNDVERYLFGSGASTPPIVQYNYSDIEKHFVIDASGTTDDGNVTCNKTFAQIKDAIDDGFRIELRYSHGNPMLRDSNDWIVDQVFIKYSGMDVTEVTFSDLLNDGVSGVYKSIMFNFATGSSTPTIVLEDENIASLRSGKMDKENPSGTGLLTLTDTTTNNSYKFLKVYKENYNRAVEATFGPQGEISFSGINTGDLYVEGLHVGTPTTDSDIANKQYVDNIGDSKVDNSDGECSGILCIKKPNQGSYVLSPTLEFGDNNDGKYIRISRESESLELYGFNNPNHFDPIIRGIGDPVYNLDCANKRYVDNAISNVTGKIDSVDGEAVGTLSIVRNGSGTSLGISLNSEEDGTGVHKVKIGITRLLNGSRKNREIYLEGYDYTQGTSFAPVINGVGDPEHDYDATNKRYVDGESVLVSLPSNKTINLNSYNRKRVSISGTIKELSFTDFSGTTGDCYVIFKTSSTPYSGSKNFYMHSVSNIIYPSDVDIQSQDCFALNKTYMIHFVRAKTSNGTNNTFATITEYNI